MKTFKTLIKPKKIFLVGEISGNHLNDFATVKKIILKAKKSGFDAIKIQSFSAESMTFDIDKKNFLIKDGLWKNKTLWNLYTKSSMKISIQKKIFSLCKKLKIICFASPFDTKSVDLLEKLNCPIYKLASPEIGHYQLIKKIALTKKPLIISTGMSSIKEIEKTFKFAKKNGVTKIAILYCVSNYPAKVSDFNMYNIDLLKKKFNCPIGFSDHSIDNDVAKSAILLGATIIEKHISFDNKKGVDAKFSLITKNFDKFRGEIDKAYMLRGRDFFYRSKEELKNKKYSRSIFASENIKKGQKFTMNNIKVIRPGTGLDPRNYFDLIKKRSTKNIRKFEPIPKNILKKKIVAL